MSRPQVIVPSPTDDTRSPVLPSFLCSMGTTVNGPAVHCACACPYLRTVMDQLASPVLTKSVTV